MTSEKCSIDNSDCTTGPVFSRGWCRFHWKRWREYGDPLEGPPKQDVSKQTDPCSVEGCEVKRYAKGWCSRHYQIAKRNDGDPILPERVKATELTCEYHPGRAGKEWAKDDGPDGRVWCMSCADRWRLHGDPTQVERVRGGTDGERIERWVDRSGGPACWPWTGYVEPIIQRGEKFAGVGGYGVVRGGRSGHAHRVAWEHWVGPIPDDMELDHVCHNRDLDCDPFECLHRRCCNPDHLEVVTKQENMARQYERRAAVHRRRADAERFGVGG